ncbi:hypothetical protein Q4I32_002959 [Leishmania shawi]|uniref:Uncharacterized protein n=1 Tax=Leishmania shawi TaxID=5680 RepID=A0AAW3BWS6_9TRYP
MPASSSGAVEKSRPPLQVESAPLNKEAPKRPASCKSNATSWMHPLASMEVPDSDSPPNPLFPRCEFQLGSGDDIMSAGGGAGSSILFSTTETSSIQVPEISGGKSLDASSSITSSNKRETRSSCRYARLKGLLTRRGGSRKSRKNIAVGGTTHSQTKCSGGAPQGTAIAVPSGAAVRNPLQRTYNSGGEEVLSKQLPLDGGVYDWPPPPSPLAASVSNRRGSSSPSGVVCVAPRSTVANSTLQSRSRRELCVSPLVSQSSRASSRSAVRRGGGSATSVAGLDSSEAQFIPLGSTALVNQNGSPSRLQRSYGSGVDDDKMAALTTLRNRSHRPKAISGSSLSMSASQSLSQTGSTRTPHGQALRNAGDPEVSVQSSLNARSVRDAKVALLRASHHGNIHSLRSSRTHSFQRSHSNASVGGDPMSQRASKVRPSSREKRPANVTAGALADDGRIGSHHSIGVIVDDAMRTSVPPVGEGSPLTSYHMAFPAATAVRDASSGKSEQNISISGVQRRFSRPEDNPLLEMMETSSCASQGWYEVCSGALWLPSATDQATRGRMAVTGGSSSRSMDQRTIGVGCGESPFRRSSSTRRGTFYPPRMPNGFYSFSRTGGCDSSGDSEEEIRLRERHRSRFEEVLRQLNAPMKSITVDDRVAAASLRNNSSYPSAREASVRGDVSQMENNSTAWGGIGGLDWGGGLVAFGAAATGGGNANMSTTVNANGGGWLGVGGTASSEDWYTRMRKKVEEEEKAEAATAASAAPTTATSEMNLTSTIPSSASAPMHIPAVASTSHRKASAPLETRMPAIDRTTPRKGPLPSLLSAKGPGMSSATFLTARLPSVKPQASPPRFPEPSKPLTNPVVPSAGERFVRRLPLGVPTRMQLSHTCAALGSTDGAAVAIPTRPPEANAAEEDDAIASSSSPPPRLRANSAAVPVSRVQCVDTPGAAPLLELEAMEPCRPLRTVGTSDGSVSGVGVKRTG